MIVKLKFKYLGGRLLSNGQSKDDMSLESMLLVVFYQALSSAYGPGATAPPPRMFARTVHQSILSFSLRLRVEGERILEVFYHRYLRTILRVNYTDASKMRQPTGVAISQGYPQAIQERRLMWFGQVLRRPHHEFSATALDPAPLPNWGRQRGSQLKT
uniref:Uncharacterized protein n=1 Tax=Schistocephalus solidus TaxID=70667 RepID=A0A0V0J5B2_SCHSO